MLKRSKPLSQPWIGDLSAMQEAKHTKVALITGGSRGIGAATALALADRGYDILITYRNKVARANEVIVQATRRGVRACALGCDITKAVDLDLLYTYLNEWSTHLDVLVLNASGGLEREALALDPNYPMHINCDAQLALLDKVQPLMAPGATLVFVTSHWAHLYGQVEQIPSYEPVAASKYAGEQAIRTRLQAHSTQAVRFAIVTGDLIDGTITPKLLERAAPGLAAHRRSSIGPLPTTEDMGEAIALAATDSTLPFGHVSVIGGTLEAFH
jgi:NAD(P)-dependent dehydrogenase (short-subunit alcohol dehydrogenase family)